MPGARNIHALAGALRRLENEAATGHCAICGDPSVGFVSRWDGVPNGICERHARLAPRHGFVVHREIEAGESCDPPSRWT